MYWLPALLVVAFAAETHAQATAQTSVAPDLRECYTDPFLLNRNNLPPTNINILIDIIRRIEDDPNVNVDLRTLATLLLHTYRQDGIQHHQRDNIAASANVLPFSPTFNSFHRHRLVLRLVPSNLQTLPNNTISSQLKCALHHMLSTTVDIRVRGDENNCGRLAQYRALRTSRSYRSVRSVNDDVEILDLTKLGTDRNGQMQQSPDSDVEYSDSYGVPAARQVAGSACPILTGVINTRWGAVSAGNLIAGIAAGAEAQRVPILELTKGAVLNYQNVPPTIATIYPATLSGDLAEAVLIQGTRGSTNIAIGSAGNWNSSQATRFYMLSTQQNVEMSDPEIRGGIDGFVLGTTLTQTLATSNTLRLSTLLDMYYSPRNGVFNRALLACNRRELNERFIAPSILSEETRAFAAVLDSVMPLEGTLTGGLEGLVDSSINNFRTYIGNNLNDLNCDITETTSGDVRHRTNLYIALDPSWPYATIYPAISYLLDSIEVGKFGSSVTLISASDGRVVLNRTFSLSEFHSLYTPQLHTSLEGSLNLEVSLQAVRELLQSELRNETASNYIGGNATVLMYLISNGNIEVNANLRDQARLLNERVPDLRVFYATTTNLQEALGALVRDPQNDIVQISPNTAGTNTEVAMSPALDLLNRVHRRVINPLCGSDFVDQSSGQRQFDDFVEPGFINFYRIIPNYFFGNNGNTRVRVVRAVTVGGTLTVCHSRTVASPRSNTTFVGVDTNEITCQNLASSGNVEINLSGACDGFPTIGECPPLHLSVQSITVSETTTAICTNPNLCRFPYNIAYQIQIDDLRCFSSGTSIISSVIFVLFGLFVNMYRSL